MITGMPRIAIAVNNFNETISFFKDKLGMPVMDISDRSVEHLGAKLAMCIPEGGSNIELMSPEVADAPLSQSLQRFLDRRGDGLFALMLEAPDPNAEAETLINRGLNVLPMMSGAGGRDIHPNSTHGVLIRVYPVNSFKGQEDSPVATESPTEDEGASSVRLSGITRIIIAVNSIDLAVTVYGTRLGMEITAPVRDEQRGVLSAICSPPSGGKIELLSVADNTRPFAKSIEEFLLNNREGMYSIVLQSADLEATSNILTTRGIKINSTCDSKDAIEIDRNSTFGALIRIESS